MAGEGMKGTGKLDMKGGGVAGKGGHGEETN